MGGAQQQAQRGTCRCSESSWLIAGSGSWRSVGTKAFHQYAATSVLCTVGMSGCALAHVVPLLLTILALSSVARLQGNIATDECCTPGPGSSSIGSSPSSSLCLLAGTVDTMRRDAAHMLVETAPLRLATRRKVGAGWRVQPSPTVPVQESTLVLRACDESQPHHS